MNEHYEKIVSLIKINIDIAKFSDFGDGISDEWIRKAESYLEIILPPSYKWCLKNYSGGEIGSEEIFSIYEMDFEAAVGGDIVHMHILNKRSEQYNQNHLVVCNSDIDGEFYFNIEEKDSSEEYPIYSRMTESIYAKDFLEFLEKRILAYKGRGYPLQTRPIKKC